jgi:hypothetical protein
VPTQSQRVGLPGLFAALHSPLPHSIYIGSQLIRINAGTFGGKMVKAQRRKWIELALNVEADISSPGAGRRTWMSRS